MVTIVIAQTTAFVVASPKRCASKSASIGCSLVMNINGNLEWSQQEPNFQPLPSNPRQFRQPPVPIPVRRAPEAFDPDLARIVAAWATLSRPIRAVMLTLLAANQAPGSKGWVLELSAAQQSERVSIATSARAILMPRAAS
jgi:hypothetical protein